MHISPSHTTHTSSQFTQQLDLYPSNHPPTTPCALCIPLVVDCSSHVCPHIMNLYSVLLYVLSLLYHVYAFAALIQKKKKKKKKVGGPLGGHCSTHGYPNPGANTLRWGHTAEATTDAGLYGTMACTPFAPQWFRQPRAWRSAPYLRLRIRLAPPFTLQWLHLLA